MSERITIPDEAIDRADIWSGQIPRADLRTALETALEYLVDHCGWTPPAVEPQPAQPRVWRLLRTPAGKPNGPEKTTRWRQHEGRWEVRADDDWTESIWDSMADMEAAGYELTEVPETQDVDALPE